MRFSENRIIALAVLAACVLVSVFGLGGIGLANERGKVLKVFDEGADTKLSVRHSMDAYLDSAAESVNLMASEAELLVNNGVLVESLRGNAAVIGEDASIDNRYTAYTALKADVDKLYNQAYEATKANDSFKNFKLAYDDFWGYDDLIQRDEYHQLARKFNALAKGFPGSLVAAVTGNRALNTFGG